MPHATAVSSAVSSAHPTAPAALHQTPSIETTVVPYASVPLDTATEPPSRMEQLPACGPSPFPHQA